MKEFDLIILGGGAAAFAAAIEADTLGIKTAIINTGLPMGGTCVNVGCVPTKHLLALAKEFHAIGHPRFKGIKANPPSLDFKRSMDDMTDLVSLLRKKNYLDILAGLKNVAWFDGRGSLVSQDVVMVNDDELKGRHVLIATGCRTQIPPIDGLEDAGYITNREALSLKRLPSSLIVIGGGSMALEFAQIFSRFGVKVKVLVRKRILGKAEPEIADALQSYLRDEGVEIYTGVKFKKVIKTAGGKAVIVDMNGKEDRIEGEEILVATGVRGNIEGLNLEGIGIETPKGCNIKVNEYLQTNIPNIWAAGDVVCHICLETVAAKEGKIAVENAFKGAKKRIDLSSLPYAVFTDPEVASVGITEAEYMERYGVCYCRTVPLSQVPKALAVKDTRGLIKIVAHHQTNKIMGVHMLAPHASEIIHEAALAVKFGLTIDDLIDTIHVFPTYSEAIKIAAQSFRRDISRMSCCVE
ncbi:MAG: mercury(II) reductase [Candidatus Omnitrophica bacterium]|nr:mercury(II) reductase [Candidatus Omnitrophota bacterium]